MRALIYDFLYLFWQSMERDNELFLNDLFRINDLTPLGLDHGLQEPFEEHKLIPYQPHPKKGRPKGLKNDSMKSKKAKDREQNPLLKKRSLGPNQNKRYHWFLQLHNKHFVNKHLRRMDKIFKTMAIFVGTRQAEQCRSHHQKMEKKYHTFFRILYHLRNAFYKSTSTGPMIANMEASGIEYSEDLIESQAIEKNLNSSEQEINEELQRSLNNGIRKNRFQYNQSLLFVLIFS